MGDAQVQAHGSSRYEQRLTRSFRRPVSRRQVTPSPLITGLVGCGKSLLVTACPTASNKIGPAGREQAHAERPTSATRHKGSNLISIVTRPRTQSPGD